MSQTSNFDDVELSTSDENETIYLEQDLQHLYGVDIPEVPYKDKAIKYAKTNLTCSRDRLKNFIFGILPVLKWLPSYDKSWAIGDIAAGCTLGIVNVPQGMAYALLASVPPVFGLYTSFFPAIFYGILATSRHVSIGTFAVISLMVGNVVDKNVPPCPVDPTATPNTTTVSYNTTQIFGSGDFPTTTSLSCEEEYNRRKVEYAIALAVAVGILQVLMYLLKLGFITIYLSEYLVSAFTCGASYHVLTSQVPKLLGLSLERQSGPLALVYTYIEVFKNIASANPWDVLVSVCCIIFLVIGKEINMRYKHKLPFPPPWELVVVILSTVASEYGYLSTNHDVEVVGNIPTGIQVIIPQPTDIGQVILDAIPIAIVAFAIEISLAQMFSIKYSYDIDSNQELFAMGAANIASSFFGCFPCASSLSRTAIWDEVGGKTQITGMIQAVIILIILLWIGPLFESLPQAALASIIVVNLKRLLLQFMQVKPLWRMSKLDALTWVITWLAVVLLGVDLGLGVAVGFELLSVVFRTQMIKGRSYGEIRQAQTYKSVKYYKIDNEDEEDILLYKFSGPIYFANKESFKEDFFNTLGIDPNKQVMKMTMKMIKKEKVKKEKVKPVVLSSIKRNCEENDLENSSNVIENKTVCENEENGNLNIEIKSSSISKSVRSDSTDRKSSTLSSKTESISKYKHVVLDMSACSFIDSDGAKVIKSLHNCFKELEINFSLAGCNREIRNILHIHCTEWRPPFFISVDGAMAHARGDVKLVLNDLGKIDKEVKTDNNETTEIDREGSTDSGTA